MTVLRILTCFALHPPFQTASCLVRGASALIGDVLVRDSFCSLSDFLDSDAFPSLLLFHRVSFCRFPFLSVAFPFFPSLSLSPSGFCVGCLIRSSVSSPSSPFASARALKYHPFPCQRPPTASLDVSLVAQLGDVAALQPLLHNIAFCDITTEDLRGVDSNFVKVFQLAQLMLEYVLSSQEELLLAKTAAEAARDDALQVHYIGGRQKVAVIAESSQQ